MSAAHCAVFRWVALVVCFFALWWLADSIEYEDPTDIAARERGRYHALGATALLCAGIVLWLFVEIRARTCGSQK